MWLDLVCSEMVERLTEIETCPVSKRFFFKLETMDKIQNSILGVTHQIQF